METVQNAKVASVLAATYRGVPGEPICSVLVYVCLFFCLTPRTAMDPVCYLYLSGVRDPKWGTILRMPAPLSSFLRARYGRAARASDLYYMTLFVTALNQKLIFDSFSKSFAPET